MIMSLLVIVFVSLCVYGYVRSSRAARLRWLQKLALPGTWHAEEGIDILQLQGELNGGSYVWQQSKASERGRWTLVGHILRLQSEHGAEVEWDVHLFHQGHIGLEDASGQRRLFNRQSDNVVPLHKLH